MNRLPFAALFVVASVLLLPAASSAQTAAPAAAAQPPASEVLISTLSFAEIEKRLAGGAAIDHVAEVVRGTPVFAVVRAPACQKEPTGECRVAAEIVVYQPDGTASRKADVQVEASGGTVPLTFDAQAAAGMYRIVATVRDLVSRQFVTIERRFAVK